MVNVLLYACCAGVPSSRQIEKQLHKDIAFRVLAANNTADVRTISEKLAPVISRIGEKQLP